RLACQVAECPLELLHEIGLQRRHPPSLVVGETLAYPGRELRLHDAPEGVGGRVEEDGAARARRDREVAEVEEARDAPRGPGPVREAAIERGGEIVVHHGAAAGDAHAPRLAAFGNEVQLDADRTVAGDG